MLVRLVLLAVCWKTLLAGRGGGGEEDGELAIALDHPVVITPR